MDWLKDHHNEILAIATIVIAIFTVVLALVGRSQRNISKILQRAYVSAEMDGIRDTTGTLMGHVKFRNAGHLPARKFSWLVKISTGDEQFFPPKIKKKELEGISVLPVGAEWRMGSDGIPIPQEEPKPKYLYIWGKVTYQDGFRRWWKRYLTFCHRYPMAMQRTPDGGGFCIDAEHGRYHTCGNDQN
jgi:hypothetical protein